MWSLCLHNEDLRQEFRIQVTLLEGWVRRELLQQRRNEELLAQLGFTESLWTCGQHETPVLVVSHTEAMRPALKHRVKSEGRWKSRENSFVVIDGSDSYYKWRVCFSIHNDHETQTDLYPETQKLLVSGTGVVRKSAIPRGTVR